MDTFFIRQCVNSSKHYVVSGDKSFSNFDNNRCPYCGSHFKDDIIEIPNDGKARIGFDNLKAREHLRNNGIYFVKVDLKFTEK